MLLLKRLHIGACRRLLRGPFVIGCLPLLQFLPAYKYKWPLRWLKLLVFGKRIYVRWRPDCLAILMFQCPLRRTLEINMYIGGGILGLILVVALVLFVLRRV